jgi:hypothetical protein
MNLENRVAALLAEPSSAGRSQAFEDLAIGCPLSPPEIADLCTALTLEADPSLRQIFWRLLERSTPSGKVLDLALNSIMDPAANDRGEAVRYLRFCFPDRLPALLEAFRRDPDEELRYQLTEFVRDSDIEAAVGMKIGMLPSASAEMADALVHEIAELGNLNHLEALRGLDQIEGGHSVFGEAARLLGARTGRSQAAGNVG